MKRDTMIRLKNLAFHYFRDEPAYEKYVDRMEEIFGTEALTEEDDALHEKVADDKNASFVSPSDANHAVSEGGSK